MSQQGYAATGSKDEGTLVAHGFYQGASVIVKAHLSITCDVSESPLTALTAAVRSSPRPPRQAAFPPKHRT